MSTGLREDMRPPSRATAQPTTIPSAGHQATTAAEVFESLQRTIGNRAVVDLIDLQRQPVPTVSPLRVQRRKEPGWGSSEGGVRSAGAVPQR